MNDQQNSLVPEAEITQDGVDRGPDFTDGSGFLSGQVH